MIKIFLFVWICMPFAVSAAPILLYFPSTYSAGDSTPENVTQNGGFTPICQGGDDSNSPRLPGVDQVRGFAQGAICTLNTSNGSLASEPDYVFLIDDTAELSDYLKQQMRLKNALQTLNEREVISPTVVSFSSSEGDDFDVLVVGEMAYRSMDDGAQWLAMLNQRFEPGAVIASESSTSNADDNQIWVAYHGSYYDKLGRKLENVSLSKIASYLGKQLQQLGGSAGNTPASSGTTATAPPLPNRRLNDYMRQCHSELVPLPPVWNPASPASSQWQLRGRVDEPFLAPALPSVEVWAYQSTSPEGVCFALPRMVKGPGGRPGNIDSDIKALGVICQSEQTGKACFWDNVKRPSAGTAERRPGDGSDKYLGDETIGLDPVDMRDGYNLVENCTSCHRGYNAFLVQDGTALDASSQGSPLLDMQPAQRYAPISGTPPSPSWGNPVSTTHQFVAAATTDSGQAVAECTACHSIAQKNEIAEVTTEYCAALMCGSIGANMPPGADRSNPSNWRAGYANEVAAISEKCCAVGVDLLKRDATGQPYHSLTNCPVPQPPPGEPAATCPPPPINPNP